MPISFHTDRPDGAMLTDHIHSINELDRLHWCPMCDSRASRAWGVTGRLNTPTANKQNHRVKIKILFWSLLLTQEKEPEWRVKLSAVTLSNLLQCPSSFHRPGLGHCFVAGNPHVRWFYCAAVSNSVVREHDFLFFYAAHCIVWMRIAFLPFLPSRSWVLILISE